MLFEILWIQLNSIKVKIKVKKILFSTFVLVPYCFVADINKHNETDES